MEGIKTAYCPKFQQLLAVVRSGLIGKVCDVEAPWWKTTSFEVHFEDASMTEKYFSKFLGDGLRYEISDFVSVINGFEKLGWKLTRDESAKMLEVMERFLIEKNE